MKVQIILDSFLKSYADDETNVQVEGDTIHDCLENLVIEYPAMKPIIFDSNNRLRFFNVYMNDQIVYETDFEKSVEPGSVLNVLHYTEGG
jgi:hypothetical protein